MPVRQVGLGFDAPAVGLAGGLAAAAELELAVAHIAPGGALDDNGGDLPIECRVAVFVATAVEGDRLNGGIVDLRLAGVAADGLAGDSAALAPICWPGRLVAWVSPDCQSGCLRTRWQVGKLIGPRKQNPWAFQARPWARMTSIRFKGTCSVAATSRGNTPGGCSAVGHRIQSCGIPAVLARHAASDLVLPLRLLGVGEACGWPTQRADNHDGHRVLPGLPGWP